MNKVSRSEKSPSVEIVALDCTSSVLSSMETLSRGGKTYSLLGGYLTTIKSPPADLFCHIICPRETFQWETSFHGTLDSLLLWRNMQRSVPEISKYFAYPHFDFEPDYIFGKPTKCRFQRYVVRTEIVSHFYVRVEYISMRKICLSGHSNQWGVQMPKNPENSPFLGHVNPS